MPITLLFPLVYVTFSFQSNKNGSHSPKCKEPPFDATARCMNALYGEAWNWTCVRYQPSIMPTKGFNASIAA